MLSDAGTERGPIRRSPLRCARVPRKLSPGVAGVAALLLVANPASAAAVGTTTKTLAGGSTVVAPCGPLGSAVVTYVLTAKNVTGAIVSSLPAACNGSNLWLTLTVGTTPAAQAGPLVVSGGTAAAVALSANPLAASITNAYVGVAG